MNLESAIFEIECADNPSAYEKAIDVALANMRGTIEIIKWIEAERKAMEDNSNTGILYLGLGEVLTRLKSMALIKNTEDGNGKDMSEL